MDLPRFPIVLPSNRRLKPVLEIEADHLGAPRATIADSPGGPGGGGGALPPPPPPPPLPPPPHLECPPRPCDCGCTPTHAMVPVAVPVVHEFGSVTATGGEAIVNVTAPAPYAPGDYVETTTVEGGLVDRLMPHTPDDWLKLAAGAALGFLLGRKLK